jgi:multidrug efflux pump subunit AcrA (membrane-fusion protein)
VRVRVHVGEEDGLALTAGATAQVFLPGVSGVPGAVDDAVREGLADAGAGAGPFPASVEGVAGAADPRDRTFAVDVRAPSPGGLLRAGMFARVSLSAGTVAGALLVPDAAVVADEGGYHVFVVDGDRVKKTPVRLGARVGEARLARAGLGRDVEVVVGGTGLLFDGAPITRLED